MKNFFYTILVLSGLIPATYLLIIAGLFLSEIIPSLREDSSQTKTLFSLLMGICGYIGLVIALIPKFYPKHLVKILFCLIGILGFALFMTVEGNGITWNWFTKMEEPDAWLIFMWPNIVCIILIILNLIQWTKSSKSQEITTD